MRHEKELGLKQRQFADAMGRYNSNPVYKAIDLSCSVLNLGQQAILILLMFKTPFGVGWALLALALAYIFADFVNGVVHLLMDHIDYYESSFGPLIAKFHLHHDLIRYQEHALPVIYFRESGAKVWLVFYQIGVIALALMGLLPSFLLYLCGFFAIWSSIAEVSHFLCHNRNSKLQAILIKLHLLLSKEEHAVHHERDNANYCFLNGMTNPLVNRIARKYFRGYKTGTDLHHASYV